MQKKNKFVLNSRYQPAGDQPQAIDELLKSINAGEKSQVLLGVTGSGKTFTMANLIEKTNRPTLIITHNKILAAQIYNEMKGFFPNNSVEYFVSFYDYYQPEAYVAKRDLFIEKDSQINEEIERMRHSATRALLERNDVIIVASVSCIYGIGAVETYSNMIIPIAKGDFFKRENLINELVNLHYERNDVNFVRGKFRVKGDVFEIYPSHCEDVAWRINFWDDEVESIVEFDSLTGQKISTMDKVVVYPFSHYVTPRPTVIQAIPKIKQELKERLDYYHGEKKYVEEQRLEQRTMFDLEMLETTNYCNGIENYSRYLTGRSAGEPPPTLFEYLPEDALLFVDESHVTIPQLNAMYRGDFNRKSNLAHYGFRLPSCLDNRPLKFEEWEIIRPQTLFVSATPAPWELQQTEGVFVEQIIRPTGLLDPEVVVRPATNQVDDLMHEIKSIISKGERILVTTLTKKMAEQLTEYLSDIGINVRYMHSDVDTLERIRIIKSLRTGEIDVLIGINLLREGLDIPEASTVAILDADKEGFLRSKTSLVQTIGRVSRNVNGKAILYADKITDSMAYAMQETSRRRQKQQQHNEENDITPKTAENNLVGLLDIDYKTRIEQEEKVIETTNKFKNLNGKELNKLKQKLNKDMRKAAKDLDFETAAKIRDELKNLEDIELLM